MQVVSSLAATVKLWVGWKAIQTTILSILEIEDNTLQTVNDIFSIVNAWVIYAIIRNLVVPLLRVRSHPALPSPAAGECLACKTVISTPQPLKPLTHRVRVPLKQSLRVPPSAIAGREASQGLTRICVT